MIDMSNGEWNTDGEIDFTYGDKLTAENLNNTFTAAPPIGSIIYLHKSLTGVPSIINCYVECNGQTLSDADSPLNGQVLPDLNGSNYFLRGASTSGGTGGTATHTHTVGGGANPGGASGGSNNVATPSGASSSIPAYQNMVYIMRVK